ncbi:MAG: preprotein translocase subunit YajC [Ruminococcus sp.]|jgi:preprotein translocase subunit YajC|nr:preprotein translocase subunit YajC [Ruminococcus sp.]
MFEYTVIATATDAAAAAPYTGTNMVMSILMIVFMVAIFYFFMIRPQKKKDQEQKKLRDNLQIGDEVSTIGGIIGIIVKKADDTVVIETGTDRSKIRIKTWAVAENLTVHDSTEESLAK